MSLTEITELHGDSDSYFLQSIFPIEENNRSEFSADSTLDTVFEELLCLSQNEQSAKKIKIVVFHREHRENNMFMENRGKTRNHMEY